MSARELPSFHLHLQIKLRQANLNLRNTIIAQTDYLHDNDKLKASKEYNNTNKKIKRMKKYILAWEYVISLDKRTIIDDNCCC